MKKSVLFLLPISVLTFSLVGCDKNNKNSDSRIYLSYGDMNSSEITLVDEEEMNKRLTNKETFLFVVYDGGCGCWRDFRDGILEPYIKDNHLICYAMKISDYKKTALSSKTGMSGISSSTVLGLFENGVLKTTLNTNENNELKDKGAFAKFMSASVHFPKIYFINENDVNSITSSDKTAVIYYGRSGCDDCSYVNKTILKRYFENDNVSNNLYFLDLQDSYENLSKENYQAKKDQFGLSIANNETYGYQTGMVPFFSLVENGSHKSGAVAFNDTVTKENDKYIVSNSYYTEERLPSLQYMDNVETKVIQGLELTSEDLNISTNAYWKHESAEKYYEPIIKAFLDYALAKVTYSF